jgi:hypothetical protein
LYCPSSFDHCIVRLLLTIVLSIFFWPLYYPSSFDHCIVRLHSTKYTMCSIYEYTWKYCLTDGNQVSGWLLFNAKWTNFHLYHGENTLHFLWGDDDVRFVLGK